MVPSSSRSGIHTGRPESRYGEVWIPLSELCQRVAELPKAPPVDICYGLGRAQGALPSESACLLGKCPLRKHHDAGRIVDATD